MKQEMKLKFKIDKKTPKSVINELITLSKENKLNARNVVDLAKNKDNPLHNFFEWDNSKAGEQYRLHQARILIGNVEVIVGQKAVRAFENVNIDVESGKAENRYYLPITEIISNKTLKMQVLTSALSHLNYWKDKYGRYKEVKPIVKAIDKVWNDLEEKKNKENKK